MVVLTKTTAKGSKVEVEFREGAAGRWMHVRVDGSEVLATNSALDGEIVKRVEIPKGQESKPAWRALAPLAGKYAVIGARAIVFTDDEAKAINDAWATAVTDAEHGAKALQAQKDLVSSLADQARAWREQMDFVRAKPVEERLETERLQLIVMMEAAR